MPITVGTEQQPYLLLGIAEDDLGSRGLVSDAEGELMMMRLDWPTNCDWRFDIEKDEWSQLESQPSIPLSTADEEMTLRPPGWKSIVDGLEK